jgi:hypothetical protein
MIFEDEWGEIAEQISRKINNTETAIRIRERNFTFKEIKSY